MRAKSFGVFLYKSDVLVEEFVTEVTQEGASLSVDLSYENTNIQQSN